MNAWLRALLPEPVAADTRERARVALGGAVGILFTALVARWLGGGAAAATPWLVAPLGASAVLVFAVPSSPLAQPWAVVGGNTVSALVGVACVRLIGAPELAAAAAVGLAIAAMFTLRCLHPPGGASALLVALTGVTDFGFALQPVLLDSVLLVAAAMAYNAATRRGPLLRVAPAPSRAGDDALERAQSAALDAALARHNQVLDISREDLKALLHDTQLSAYRERLAQLQCTDIMTPDPVHVHARTTLQDAAALLREHRVKALPVVDANGQVVGIVTRSDLLRAEAGAAARAAPAAPPGPGEGATRARRVGDVMTRQVRVASAHRHLVELVPLFGSTGHHHLPIVDERQRLVGIVTQSDVVAALARSQPPPGRPQPLEPPAPG